MKKKKKGRLSRSTPFLRSTEWKSIRSVALERDGHKCVLCGCELNLNVHHILPRKFFKSLRLDLDNLICVCPSCHFSIHKSAGNFILAEWLMQNRPGQYQYLIDKLH